MDDAYRLFTEMKKDADPNISTYNIIIDILCKVDRLDDAYKM